MDEAFEPRWVKLPGGVFEPGAAFAARCGRPKQLFGQECDIGSTVCSVRRETIKPILKENRFMSDDVLANQNTIMSNQAEIKANQDSIKANQEEIKANQEKLDKILANQDSIQANQDEIKANQATILANQDRILAK